MIAVDAGCGVLVEPVLGALLCILLAVVYGNVMVNNRP